MIRAIRDSVSRDLSRGSRGGSDPRERKPMEPNDLFLDRVSRQRRPTGNTFGHLAEFESTSPAQLLPSRISNEARLGRLRHYWEAKAVSRSRIASVDGTPPGYSRQVGGACGTGGSGMPKRSRLVYRTVGVP